MGYLVRSIKLLMIFVKDVSIFGLTYKAKWKIHDVKTDDRIVIFVTVEKTILLQIT